MSGRGQLREHSSLTRSLILAVVAGIQLARRETLGGFQCLAIREFNYANHGQLNDSSNNRLSAERCLFIDKTCLLWHLVVFTDRYGNRAITCLSDVPPRESPQKKQKKNLRTDRRSAFITDTSCSVGDWNSRAFFYFTALNVCCRDARCGAVENVWTRCELLGFFFINLTFAQLLFECLVVRLRRSLSVACRITKIVAGLTRVRLQSLSLLTGMSDNICW